MEDFSKMIEAYRWRGEEPYTKKQHRVPCASLCASPAQATPCNAAQEQAGATIVRCSERKNEEGCSTSPNTSPVLINRSHTEPQDVVCDVGIQANQFETISCVSDDDGDLGSQGTLDRALSYSSGSYNPGQKCRLKRKLQASPRNSSSRQLVFGVKDNIGAKRDLEGRARSKVKVKKERKKSGKTQTKQNGAKVPSKQGTREDHMPEFYDDSTCEDGPVEFHSPDVAYSPVVASEPSDFEASNYHPASNKKKRRSATPIKGLARHVPLNRKSPFFAHAKQTPNPNNVKKIKKTVLSTPSKNKSAEVKVYTRKKKKASPILSREGGTFASKEGRESLGLLMESLDRKDGNADPSEGAIIGVKAAVLPSKGTAKAKTSAYFTPVVDALGQRDIANKTWVPPISVFGLIQEELYRDPWKVLVACMLLNKTCGLQMRKVIWDLFALCPTPEAAVAVATEKIEEVIWPLGLQKKRARMIRKFSKDYLGKEWVNVGQLHGIGKYAIDAYAIFCEGRWREVKPEDHKLVDYWQYLCATDGLGYAFKDDRERGCQVVCTELQAES